MTGRWISYLLCAVLWIGCVYELTLVAIRALRGTIAETPLIGTLLSKSAAADALAPTAIIIVFAWVLVEVFLHFIRVWREHNAALPFVSVSESESRGLPLSELRRVPPRSRAGRRAALLVMGMAPEAIREAIPGFAAVDASAVESRYAFIRVYIWILPVIGFIGTAWGMSHAIAGFSDALKETSEIQTLTARLSQLVIPGLANAFSITILALVAAIVAHFCASAIHAGELAVLNRLDEASVRLLAKLPTSSQLDLVPVAVAIEQGVKQLAELRPAAAQLGAAAEALKSSASELVLSARLPYHVSITREQR